jgi:hypothetical protein
MPERLTLETVFPTLITTLTMRQLKGITHGSKGELQGLTTFTNLVYQTLICLQDHPLVGKNPYLTMDDRFAFALRLMRYIYDRSLILVHYDFYPLWKQQWKAINQRIRHRMKHALIEDGYVGGAAWQRARDQKRQEIQHLHDTIQAQVLAWFAPKIQQLLTVTILNPSPWEQAFFMALFGNEQSRWFQLLGSPLFNYRYNLGPAEVTCAFLGREGRNTAVLILPQKHPGEAGTPHTPTEGRAQQWCTDNGWTFISFTYDDIANNLAACVEQVNAGVVWQYSPY